jgi:hypothetical protein
VALAEILEPHGAFLALDPETSALRVKTLPDDRQSDTPQS